MIRTQNDNSKHWYAVCVRSRHEKKVHHYLQRMGIETSLPLMTVVRQWSDRIKKVELPLFSGYVFVMIDVVNEKQDILRTPGVVGFVDFNGCPSIIPENQMYWMQILKDYGDIQPETSFPAGSEVKVMYGPLIDLHGVVKDTRTGNRLVVWFEAIMQGVSVEMDPACIMAAGH